MPTAPRRKARCRPPCPSNSPSASSTPSSADSCATASTRSRASAPPSTSRPRSWCSTTRPRTGRWRSRGGIRSTTEVIALPAAPRQERERLRAAAARPRALLPAAQRGLRARAGRDRRPARRAGRRRARRRRRRDARAPRRRAAALGLALPLPGTALLTALFLHRALVVQSTRRRRRGRSTGCSRRRCSSAARPPRRSATSTRTFFVYSDEVDFCRRLADAGWHTLYVPERPRRPPRAALDRQRAGAPDRRVLAQPRPLHAQAPHRRLRRARALPDGVDLRAARRRRARPARARPEALRQARQRDAASRAAARGSPRPRRSSTGG